MSNFIIKQIAALEKDLKDAKYKHKFALETLARLEKDIELQELEIRDIQNDIRRCDEQVDRTSKAAIKWEK